MARRGSVGVAAVAAALIGAVLIAAPAQGSSGVWDRAWGVDVDNVFAGTGLEICITAPNCKTGVPSGVGGGLSEPDGVATDAAGNVYVAGADNYRVQRFGSGGGFISAWGRDVISGGTTGYEVCTAAMSCKLGLQGSGGGEFTLPTGAAADPAGAVYFSDGPLNRIQKFAADPVPRLRHRRW